MEIEMDKKAIRNFAISARNILIARVSAKLAKLGVTESGIDEIIQIIIIEFKPVAMSFLDIFFPVNLINFGNF